MSIVNLHHNQIQIIMERKRSNHTIILLLALFFLHLTINAQENDSLGIHWVGHGSLYFEFHNMVIHVDPYSNLTDYASLPKADLVFITHNHGDHYDTAALEAIKKDSTLLVCTQGVKDEGTYSDTTVVLNNWDSAVFMGIPVKAVPAYNTEPGQIFHIKGVGNGYVFTFNELKVYVAGDTEDVDEMAELGKVHIAFLPMNLPYTMTPEQAANAANMISPNILYIYHFGDSDTAYFRSLVADKIRDVRIGEAVRYEKTVDLNFPNELKKNPANHAIKLFPNPIEEYFMVNNYAPKSHLFLFDSVGNIVINRSLDEDGSTEIDSTNLKKGYYLVGIIGKESQQYFSLVKL